MSDDKDDDKRYDPTPQRRARFRREGHFARSRDAGAIAGTIATLAILWGTRDRWARSIGVLFAQTVGSLDGPLADSADRAPWFVGTAVATLAMPAMFAGAIAAVAVTLAQAGLHFQSENILKFSRLDPIARVRELLQWKRATTETVLALARIVIVAGAAYLALKGRWHRLVSLARVPLSEACADIFSIGGHVLLATLGALALVSAADYGQSWLQLRRQLRMSRKELMDETKAEEGDPKAKAQMRARMRALIRKRSIANVRKASVVVTNPTHVAVALRYGSRDPAPVVVAKGHDELALAIRREARRHGVPIVENRKLARALDAEVPLGRTVPMAHFAAVARVIAFVYRLKSSRGGTQRA